MDPLRKRFFVNGKPVAGSVLHAQYLKPASVLLNAMKQRMQLGNLQHLAQRYATEDGATLTAMSRFGQDEIRIDVPYRVGAPASIPVPSELIYRPVVREIPSKGRILIATGPGGRIYTPNRTLTGLDLVTDFVTVGPVGGIAATRDAFCITEPEGWSRWEGDTLLGGGGIGFYTRQWGLATRFAHHDPRQPLYLTNAVSWGIASHNSRFLLNVQMQGAAPVPFSMYSIAYNSTGVELDRFLHGDASSPRGVASRNGGMLGVIRDALTPFHSYLHKWEPTGEPTERIADLDTPELLGLTSLRGALFALRIDTGMPGTLRRIVKLSPLTGEVLALSEDLQFWNAAQYSPVVADERYVYVIGFESREDEEIAYVVRVLDYDLALVASIDVPPPVMPEGSPAFYFINTFAIGFDPYWRAGATIDDGIRIAPAGTF